MPREREQRAVNVKNKREREAWIPFDHLEHSLLSGNQLHLQAHATGQESLRAIPDPAAPARSMKTQSILRLLIQTRTP
jgi:hypothetical protein